MIDLRSDTVTQPTAAMRAAMAAAAVGDDVYGEDPTVNRLEQEAAALLGVEAALFVSSGTQGNLLAILCHCQRGDEYIAGQTAHCYRSEGGGAAVLGGIQPQPLDFQPDGTLSLAQVAATIKPDNPHYARTRLLCLENTQAGRPLPLSYLAEARQLTTDHGLALHLDGARLFNAAVAQGVSAREIMGHVDSASICLSKGLGAPVGSLLCSSNDLIATARRWRKMLGGGMRQAGILAAAGLLALHDGPAQLAADHANAKQLASGLAEAGYPVDLTAVQTNMIFMPMGAEAAAQLAAALARQGILVGGYDALRLVTHRDIRPADIETAIAAFSALRETVSF